MELAACIICAIGGGFCFLVGVPAIGAVVIAIASETAKLMG